ncbi:hypothetical protein PVAP13_7KG271200 [Panicum virgatum]|uniref:Uncharacterized protein n=1 Tax=Panicum virgatum TaxID=38727 RepID=A0A8T0QK84_PANVG|nr:hypothetical protein PVAP13_7KG271200 [Panicum virgatum]
MQQFVCIYLSEHHQTNHFMLSESLTTLDIAWPLFQVVRSLVLSSYVIFLQRLRRGKAHQGSFEKEADQGCITVHCLTSRTVSFPLIIQYNRLTPFLNPFKINNY